MDTGRHRRRCRGRCHRILRISCGCRCRARIVRRLGRPLDMESIPAPRISVKLGFFLSDLTKGGRGNFNVTPGSHLKDEISGVLVGCYDSLGWELHSDEGSCLLYCGRVPHVPGLGDRHHPDIRMTALSEAKLARQVHAAAAQPRIYGYIYAGAAGARNALPRTSSSSTRNTRLERAYASIRWKCAG